MLILTIAVDAYAGQAIGVKEAIAQDLEKYGDVRVISVVEKRLEQMKIMDVEDRRYEKVHRQPRLEVPGHERSR